MLANLRFEAPLAALPVVGLLAAQVCWLTAGSPRRRGRRGLALLGAVVASAAGALAVAADSASGPPLVLAIAVLLQCALAAHVAYGETAGAASRGVRRAGRLLRFAALLLIVALLLRPVWVGLVAEWHKPALVVLHDSSRSMSIAESGLPRAERVNALLQQESETLSRLAGRFDVRRFAVGETCEPLTSWTVHPTAELSALSAGLADAGRLRDADGAAPVAIILISDGAENAAVPQRVTEVADALARQGTALLAVAAAGRGGDPPIVWEPLRPPGRVRPRERMTILAAATVRALTGSDAVLEARWDGATEPAARQTLPLTSAEERVRCPLILTAPAGGVHRLALRLSVDTDGGRVESEQSVLIEVGEDRIRVVMIEARPRPELGFISRALSDEKRYELTRVLLPDATALDRLRDRLDAGCDVVLLGPLNDRALDVATARHIVELVSRAGVGLLLHGGESLAAIAAARSPLAAVCPVDFAALAAPLASPLRITVAGRAHALLADEAGREQGSLVALIESAPPLAIGVLFREVYELGVVLAVGNESEPLLVASEVGAGRTLVAAWDATWPWALQSDDGARAHTRFWRQAVGWLANRRPAAWVATDAWQYLLSGVQRGRQSIRIRAGVVGFEREPPVVSVQMRVRAVGGARGSADSSAADGATPAESSPASSSTSQAVDAGWLVPLKRVSGEWQAELPRDLRGAELAAGGYELEFSVEVQRAADAGLPPGIQRLSAQSRFELLDRSLEFDPPTQDLALLEAAALRTAEIGGAFLGLDELPQALERWAARDLRRRVEREVRSEPVGHSPAAVLTLLVAILGAEWAMRRRSGLV